MLSKEQEAFKQIFADSLRAKVDSTEVYLETGGELQIADEFIHALIEFKSALANNIEARMLNKGELSWSEQREKIISDFSKKLDHVFEKVGGIKPENNSAYWSGAGVQRAKEFGLDFEKTIPGFVINKIQAALQETFTKRSYLPDGALDTATNVGMWDSMSKLYAEGTISDANVFLVDGETSQHSIFWNTELQTLRKRQQTGEVKEIFIHTLNDEPLLKYRALTEQKKGKEPSSNEFLEIEKQIEALLKIGSNWSKEKIDDSNVFKLKTSGSADPHKKIDYQEIKSYASKFKQQLALIKQPVDSQKDDMQAEDKPSGISPS